MPPFVQDRGRHSKSGAAGSFGVMRKLLLFSCLLAAGPQGAAAYEDRGVPAPPGIVAESAAPPPVLDDGPAKTFIEPELVEGTCFANACENDRLSAKFANY